MADLEEVSYSHEEDEEQLWSGEFWFLGSLPKKGHEMTDMIGLRRT
jgi:hypothetical protein